MTETARGPALARFLLAVYVLLIVYASLYPLAGWRDPGVPLLGFVAAPLPRYITFFDVAANFLGYLPYGLLCVLVVHPRLRGAAAAWAAIVTGSVLSLSLETAQNFLPARIPSNLDVVAQRRRRRWRARWRAFFSPALLGGGPLQRLRAEALAPGTAADLGLTLLGLWLFAQLNPATLLFGTGDLRDLVAGPAGARYGAELFVSVEAVIAAANLAAVALLAPPRCAPVRRCCGCCSRCSPSRWRSRRSPSRS